MPGFAPQPVNLPAPLPEGLLASLAGDHRIALFLDYDGTLSEITPDVANAVPVAGARELIGELTARPDRFTVIIISGRHADQLMRLAGLSHDVILVGSHGLEIIEPDGRRRAAVDPSGFMPAVESVKAWLHRNVPPSSGFLIEDKRFSVALHYRLANPGLAGPIRARLSEFVTTQTPALRLGEGKMVVEAMAREANKGAAVQTLMREVGAGRLPLYFGDDVTDEDAFYVLRETGITVKIGNPPIASWAKYRIDSPADVTAALAQLIAGADAANAR